MFDNVKKPDKTFYLSAVCLTITPTSIVSSTGRVAPAGRK